MMMAVSVQWLASTPATLAHIGWARSKNANRVDSAGLKPIIQAVEQLNEMLVRSGVKPGQMASAMVMIDPSIKVSIS